MATLALAAVGSAFGPIGTFIGGLVGGFIDRQFLFPALFGSSQQQTIYGPRLDQIQLSGNSEGSPMAVAIGSSCRVPASYIYMSDLIETTRTTTTSQEGGKGGGGQSSSTTTVTYLYSIDCALGLCNTIPSGALVSVDKILADGKVLFDARVDILTVGNTNIAFQVEERVEYEVIETSYSDGGSFFTNQTMQRSVSTVKGYVVSDTKGGGLGLDDYIWQLDSEVTISGSSQAANNGDFVLSAVTLSNSASSNTQLIDLDGASGGTFTITFDGQTTAAIAYDASAASVQSALEALSNIGAGNVSVSNGPDYGQSAYDPAASDQTWSVAFASALADMPLPKMTIDTSLTTWNAQTNRTRVPGVICTQIGNIALSDMLEFNEVAFVPTEDDGADTIVLAQDVDEWDPRYLTDLQIELGFNDTVNQAVLTELEAIEGVGDTPRFLNTAVAFIKGLKLAHWGNRPPASVNAIVDSSRNCADLADAFTIILEQAGLEAAEFDVTALVGETFRGYVWVGTQQPARLLEPLMIAYNVDMRDADGVLTFFMRGEESEVTIDGDRLAVHRLNERIPGRIVVKEVPPFDLPSQVIVRHRNVNNELNPAAQTFRRVNRPTDGDNIETLDLELSLSPDEARIIAKRLTWEPSQDRLEAEIILPPSAITISEGSILSSTNDDGEAFQMRVLSAERGDDYTMFIRGVLTDGTLLDISADTDTEEDEDGSGSTYVPPATVLHMLQLAPLVEDHVETAGVYFAMAATNPDAEWEGGELHYSETGSGYALVQVTGVESTCGSCDSALADGTVDEWDLVNTVTVTLVHGTLSSVTELECLNGSNRAVIGNEIVGFQTATLVSGRTYTLSKLIRGLGDTREFTAAHAVGERFVLLDEVTTGFREEPSGDEDDTKYYKAVGVGGSVSGTAARTINYNAQTVKCFSPGNFEASRDAVNDDITFSWVHRSRRPSELFGAGGNAAVEASLDYEIDIIDIGTGTVVRTIEVSNVTEATYTEAQQTSDLGSTEAFMAIIYQVGTIGGRGNGRSLSVASA